MTGERDDSDVLFTRRGYLGALGGTAVVAVGASQATSADEQGYGTSGYGLGSYGGEEQTETEAHLDVTTLGGTDIESTSARVIGDLTELDGTESATVYFEWGTSSSLSQSTEDQTVESTGEFDAVLSGLETNTEYQVRAVATADGTRVTGETATFQTKAADEEPEEGIPEIEVLTGEDVSNPRNPHVDAELTWEASIDNSELYAAQLVLSDEEETLNSWTYNLSGQHAEATETERVPLGALDEETEYTADLVVYSYYGNTDRQTTTFESQ